VAKLHPRLGGPGIQYIITIEEPPADAPTGTRPSPEGDVAPPLFTHMRNRDQAAESSKAGSRESDSLSAAESKPSRYGNETLVLSPELLMVKVPADCTGV